jgi:hypothetical protein
VGTTAWVIPQILTARPAAGATMSGLPATLAGTTGTPIVPVTTDAAPDAPSTLSTLATTGLDLQRDAEIGAVMIAVGWALHRWASRSPEVATRPATVHGMAGSQGDSA